MAADWTLVTVTHNSVAQLRACWTRASYGDARWVVVDNASTDGSPEIAASLGAEVVELEHNVGFGAANNVALRSVATTYVAFVNPDVTVPAGSDLDRLAAVSRANEQALVAPQLLNPDGSEQPNGRGLPFLADKIANRTGRFPGSRLHEYARTGLSGPTYCAWTIGAAIGGPTVVWQELGGWDERYFIYYEDHDIGLRSWAAGHPVVLDPATRWMHEWQRATTRIRLAPWKHEVRSARHFYATYPTLVTRRRRQPRELDLAGARAWRPAADPG